MNGELLTVLDYIEREKGIDRETLFQAVEASIFTAATKKYGEEENLQVRIDRKSGKVQAFDEEGNTLPLDLGRIAAQTAKQVIMQKIREEERRKVYEDLSSSPRFRWRELRDAETMNWDGAYHPHVCWTHVFGHPDLYEWLRSMDKDSWPAFRNIPAEDPANQ